MKSRRNWRGIGGRTTRSPLCLPRQIPPLTALKDREPCFPYHTAIAIASTRSDR